MVKPAAPSGEQKITAAKALDALRSNGGLVHCLTNLAAAAFSADVLLAIGARPSLTHAPAEVAGFAQSADALLVNLGTLDAERRSGIDIAAKVMSDRAAPWVLDPVLCNRSAPRRELALELLARRPAVLRLNPRELEALTGEGSTQSAHELARTKGLTVMLTGPVDFVSDGNQTAALHSGHKFMDLGTAYGCAGGAVTAACLTVSGSPFDAALSSLMIFNLAGEIAGRVAGGPGSFRPTFLDALYMLETDDLSLADFS